MAETTFNPRPSQQKILDALLNANGPIRLGVSAVPGSGKTETLSQLAAQIIVGGQEPGGPEAYQLALNQEVLIVTLVNSAVDSFRQRIGKHIQARGLLPYMRSSSFQ